MPHKHKRKRGDDEEADFNLPPTQTARPLPVVSNKFPGAQWANPKNMNKKKGRGKDDDAPRAFKRLMAVAQGKKLRSGLDNGDDGKTTARKVDVNGQPLKIQPGEDLRSFASRVDAAMPVSGLTKKTVIKDGKDEAGMKVYRTRKERKMHKLYDQWRAEDVKIKDKREEELEEAAERELDDEEAGGMAAVARAELEEATSKSKKKKAGRGKDDDDPWLQLKKKRAEARVGLHDTAQAPPELNKKIKQLQINGAAVNVGNIPKSAGSLRRREELEGVRADVVDAYRKIREHEQAKLNKLNEK
ncbi:hypothetical protein B0T10DRAFT_482775 [Thelonectria olida]|uniref:Uncharacterized protein n=1 Tax=Thelonectria olida TaxID=1576542 RepID=A0A9P8WAJ1_9HYPO|nr:hypothetical protein B0T10DRAFT_482775 [Thelonectria olida]